MPIKKVSDIRRKTKAGYLQRIQQQFQRHKRGKQKVDSKGTAKNLPGIYLILFQLGG